MPLKITNNAASRLAGTLTTTATNIGILPGDGAKFPALDAGDWFPLTLVKGDGALEIVKCTARSADTFTVVRGQEGTAALAFAAGDRVELRLTKAALDEFKQVSGISPFMDEFIALTSAELARNKLSLGTAATRDTQASTHSTETNALLAPGAYGWGNVSAALPLLTDANGTRAAGLYAIQNGAANVPLNAQALLEVRVLSAQVIYQEIRYFSVDRAFTRYWNTSAWSAWSEVWHAKSFDPATKQDKLTYTPLQADTAVIAGFSLGRLDFPYISNGGANVAYLWSDLNAPAKIANWNAQMLGNQAGGFGFLKNLAGVTVGMNTLVAGSNLSLSDTQNNAYGSPAGTWRALSAVAPGYSSLFVRVS